MSPKRQPIANEVAGLRKVQVFHVLHYSSTVINRWGRDLFQVGKITKQEWFQGDSAPTGSSKPAPGTLDFPPEVQKRLGAKDAEEFVCRSVWHVDPRTRHFHWLCS